MIIYEVTYGVGGIAYGGYNRATIVAAKKENIQGLINEQEGEEVLITSIVATNEDASSLKFEQVVFTTIA